MAAVDRHVDEYPGGVASSPEWPCSYANAVTPHDTNELAYVSRCLYVGGAGNVKVTTKGGDTVTFTGVLAGSILPVRAKIVFSTGTTATTILALD